MESSNKKNNNKREKRALRVRRKLHGTSARPRLCVVKSNKHISVQLIDDDTHTTLGSASTFSNQFRETEFCKKNKASAAKLGEAIAEIAKAKNIKEVIFDRGEHKYHGVLAELANSARNAGLQF